MANSLHSKPLQHLHNLWEVPHHSEMIRGLHRMSFSSFYICIQYLHHSIGQQQSGSFQYSLYYMPLQSLYNCNNRSNGNNELLCQSSSGSFHLRMHP
mmetsp:Transcript_33168/g.56348  ORF Transcript_33168/g.56348 Transcript_33168/m.56348 type:complete len:97 (+) Transcript_33168:194-484(+)